MSRGSIVESLVGRAAAKTFASKHWGHTHARGKVARGTMRLFERELLDFDVRQLVARNGDKTQAWFETIERRSEITTPPSPDESLALYDAGLTLYLKDAGTERLNQWQTRLALELGHPETKTKFSLFASRRSAGTSYHFDALENFTIQLRGHKRWHLAPNRHVINPMENWFAGDVVPPELQLHAHRTLPKSIREPAYVVDLRPGDVLYIPRGYWHATETGQDSLSAFVGFQLMSWAEFVGGALAARLGCEPEWRKNVTASWSNRAFRHAARRELTGLLDGLADQVRGLTIDEIAPELRVDKPRLDVEARRNPLATLIVKELGSRAVVTTRIHRRSLETNNVFDVSAELVRPLEWIAARRRGFTTQDVRTRFPRVRVRLIEHVIGLLLDTGYLVARSDT